MLSYDDEYRYVAKRRLFRQYGEAVNFCVKRNIPLKEIELMSKNKEIEKICGMRRKGMPIDFPFELDYHCPICGKEPILVGVNNEIELLHLHFSEYNYFMWCERCNIDIPSFLCLKANSKKAVAIYTERYLAMIKEIQQKAKENVISEVETFIDAKKKSITAYKTYLEENIHKKHKTVSLEIFESETAEVLNNLIRELDHGLETVKEIINGGN